MQNINIKAVVKLTGINENTLRAWERRYQIVAPVRSEDGHRLYSKKDIEKLTLVWKLVQRGHQISRLATLSLAQIKKMDEEVGTQPLAPATVVESEMAKEVHLKSIINALKAFNLDALQRSLVVAKFEMSPRTIIRNLILPLLREVGQQVAESKLTISQEHLLSSLLRDHLGSWYQSLSPYEYRPQLSKQKILITTREGDLHEFGILLAAILCRLHGHETYYLGPNMPANDLAQACTQFKITTVIIGLMGLPPEKEFISAADYLTQLDELTAKKINFYYGGAADVPVTTLKSERKTVQFKTLDELDSYLMKIS